MYPLLKTLLTQPAINLAPTTDEEIPESVTEVTLVPLSTIEIVCRVCFKGFTSGCVPLSTYSGFAALRTIEKVLKHVIPEMNIPLIKDSSICSKCWNDVSEFYKLKLECLQMEQNFYEFLAKNGQEDDINAFVKQSRVENDFKNTSYDTLVDSETFVAETDFKLSHEEYTIINDASDVETGPLEISNEEQNVEIPETTNEEPTEDCKIISCASCQTECRNLKEALHHTTEAHGVFVVLCCNYCCTFFMDSESLIEHLLEEHNKQFSCPCGEKFISNQLLAKHVKSNRECAALKKQEMLTCRYCNLVFEEKKLLTKHKRIHNRKLFTCEICGKSHANNHLLQEHKYIHSDIKRFMCEKCGKCFKQRSILWIHNNTKHIKIKKIQCPHCPQKFYNKSKLEAHQIVHTKEKKYECHVCLKRFTTTVSVKRHLMIHTGEKFQCNRCGHTNAQMYDLKKHVCTAKNTTEGGKSEEAEGFSISVVPAPASRRKSNVVKSARATCEICNQVVKRTYLKYHIRKHTGEKPEICKVCGKSFGLPASLGRHMMLHTGRRPFKCEECNHEFIQKVDYEAHMRRKHTGERPYECQICDKAFVEFSQLYRHKKSQAHLIAVESAGE